ncbi:hypothetical protein MMC21_007752 [Puttea exsequens]|nr:hypothetical protein [Puttea exsequens]
MLAQTLRRTFITSSATHPPTLPPTFLLPLRARLPTTKPLTTEAHTTAPSPLPPAYTTPIHQQQNQQPPKPSAPPCLSNPPTLSPHTPLPAPTHPNLALLLPPLAAQTPHYITAHIHARPYLLTQGDTLRLPFLLPSAPPGTILRLTRLSLLGSRDFTLRGDPWVDERVFVCRAVVVGVEGEGLRVREKTKRRQRRVNRVKTKGRFTVLRVRELRVFAGMGDEGGEEGGMEGGGGNGGG